MQSFTNVNPTVSRRNSLADEYSNILKESFEFFSEQGINMMADVKDILAEDALFSAYANRLCESLDPDDAEQLNQILENARLQTLQESSISGISPLAGLVMPTIRKLWLRVAMKNAIPTEAAKIPTFTISYFKPYIKEADGTKRYLPDDLRDEAKRGGIASKKALITTPVLLPTEDGLIKLADAETYEAATDSDGAELPALNILAASGGIVESGDTMDPIFAIDSVVVKDSTGAFVTQKVDIKLSHEAKLYGQIVVNVTDDQGVVTETVTDTLIGSVNLSEGLVDLTSLKGNVTAVTFRGSISSETNRNSQSVGYDIDRKNITIGTGAHINAPLPIEMVQDSMALYNVDATLEVVDIMSNVVAQKLEYEIVDFFDNSFEAQGRPFIGYFDVKPAAGFAGSPLMWREEIRRVIDYQATKLKNHSAFTNGYFVIFGNPLDMQIIPNVSWTFTHTTDQKGGVEVEYDMGAFSGAHKYHLVSSLHVPQGKLRMFFVPESDKYMTYKYYPYTFNIEKGYLDPQNTLVPSIMMTKRHTIEEFIPVAAEIIIYNNDGSFIERYDL